MADWTTDAVDSLDQAVTAIREKTVEPAQRGARAVVFGLLVAFFVVGSTQRVISCSSNF